ncbi:hypothetical protein G7046_g1222 [Stylonectria norvegica]|nr:hypothetical protein G7046_g1222 [Stylonectria norvegica]
MNIGPQRHAAVYAQKTHRRRPQQTKERSSSPISDWENPPAAQVAAENTQSSPEHTRERGRVKHTQIQRYRIVYLGGRKRGHYDGGTREDLGIGTELGGLGWTKRWVTNVMTIDILKDAENSSLERDVQMTDAWGSRYLNMASSVLSAEHLVGAKKEKKEATFLQGISQGEWLSASKPLFWNDKRVEQLAILSSLA